MRATAISINPAESKHKNGIAAISENPNNSSRASTHKEDETLDIVSNNDKSEASVRSDYIKKGTKRKLLLTLQQELSQET